MIIEERFAINSSLNVVSIILLSLLIVFFSTRKKYSKQRNIIAIVTLLTLFGNFTELLGGQYTLMNSKHTIMSAFNLALAYMFYGFAYLNIFRFPLTDGDGNIKMRRLVKKKNFIVLNLMSWPIMFNMLFHVWNKNIYALGFSMTIACLIGYFCFLLEKEKEVEQREKTIREERNNFLTKQIHPHFVFNSLMAIEEMCYSDSELAARSINNLAHYLRSSIESLNDTHIISFKKELDNIAQYVELEKAASSKEFRVEYDLEIEDFKIPILTIQPLVENAIRHGMSKNIDNRVVKITTRKKGDFVVITVFDNGEKIVNIKETKNKTSIGFNNVKERLEQTYSGSLKIKHDNDGTKAIVTIPLEKEA